MQWHNIDLGPGDKSHAQAQWRDDGGTRYVWVYGSDHWRDWLHHFLPGARVREIRAARRLVERIMAGAEHVHAVILGGHSMGGAIAAYMHYLIAEAYYDVYVRSHAFGAKRATVGPIVTAAYYHRGDVVRFVWPWRPRYNNVHMFGDWALPWVAHHPRVYRELAQQHGLRG